MNTVATNTKIIQTAILICVGLIVNSCQDFLDVPLQGKLTQSDFPTSAKDALMATNAIYLTQRDALYHTGLFPIDDIMSDDARKGSNPDDQASTIGPYDNFVMFPSDPWFANWWNTLYQGVLRANVVIQYVPLISMDATLRDRYVGEAKFLRALFYFDLVKAWGGVPLTTTAEPNFTINRASKEDVWDLIEQDLKDAIASLPDRDQYPVAEAGRATAGAAHALLGKAHLYQGEFSDAAQELEAVINSGLYDLEPDFDNANSVIGEFGVESVYEIGAVDGDKEGTENGTSFYANVQAVRGTPNRGWGFNRPSLDLIASFEANDPRLASTVIYLGEVLDGVTIAGDGGTPNETKNSNGVLIEIECYNQKVWTPGQIVAQSQGHNRRLIRFADVLLMAAEALNENNNPTQALIYLNRVRQRAREGNNSILPDITVTNKGLLRDIILQERRVELALEGHRFWDLVRTGKAPTVLGPLGFTTGKHELFPIPQAEIELTQNRLAQNPGWEE
jgi:starch-binding outer membrane protein, SusD/RagB family